MFIIKQLRRINDELQGTNTLLDQRNAEPDPFVYAASHDLRSPITNTEGRVQALVEQLPTEVQQVELVELILTIMQDSMARFRHTLDRLADFGTTQQ